MNVRPATAADAAALYRWRVEGEQADWYEGPPTTLEGHRAWLETRLHNPVVRIWVAEHADTGVPVGVVRLDSNDELSVEVDAAYRGHGYGTRLIQWACDHAPGRVKACVDATNEPAARAFHKAGFHHRPDVHFYLWKENMSSPFSAARSIHLALVCDSAGGGETND